MKPISTTLTQFLESNIIPIIKSKFHKTQFSIKSKHILEQLFNQIRNSNAMASLDEFNVIKKQSDEIDYGKNFDWCPPEIKTHIENMEKVQYETAFEVDGRDVTVYLICNKKTTAESFQEVISKIYIWLSIAFRYSSTKCSKRMNIYLHFTDLKKVLPKQGEPIREIHANTAFTTFCKPSTEIHLFREEEWFKVLIHESFHCLGLDFSEFDHSETNKQVLSMFPVNSDVRIFETYCETWAELLNTMFITFNLSNSAADNQKLIKKLEGALDQERVFSVFQCAKVLNFYGLDYSDLYEKTAKAHLNRLHRYKESTHVLSYYIIKSIFMFYINDFVEWCVDHNEVVLNFNKEPKQIKKNMTEYCDFIGERYNNVEYTSILSSIDSWFEEIHPHKMKSVELQTLRMTMHEL
jgi:hypothetical protein